MQLIELLEKKRNECGMTHTEFCRQLGIDDSTYLRLRNHQKGMQLKTAKKIETWLEKKEAELNRIRTALLS